MKSTLKKLKKGSKKAIKKAKKIIRATHVAKLIRSVAKKTQEMLNR